MRILSDPSCDCFHEVGLHQATPKISSACSKRHQFDQIIICSDFNLPHILIGQPGQLQQMISLPTTLPKPEEIINKLEKTLYPHQHS